MYDKILTVKREIKIDGFHTIYYFEHNKDYIKTPEKHNFWELVYVDEGEIVAIVNGVARTLTQGTVIFHEPNEIHAHIANKKDAHNILVITFETQSEAMDFFKKKMLQLDKHSKMMLSLFLEEARKSIGDIPWIYDDECEVEPKDIMLGATQLLECYFVEFLIDIMRKSTTLEKGYVANDAMRLLASNSIMKMVVEKMESEVYSNMTLEDICDYFLIGKSKLTEEFKSCTGKTPMEYYRHIKIKEAKKLIRQDELSVSEISEKLGYSSIHIFSRAFKKEVGFAPLEYKKSVAMQSGTV